MKSNFWDIFKLITKDIKIDIVLVGRSLKCSYCMWYRKYSMVCFIHVVDFKIFFFFPLIQHESECIHGWRENESVFLCCYSSALLSVRLYHLRKKSFFLFLHIHLKNFFFRNTDCLVLNTWEKNWGIICAYNYVIMELFSFIYKCLHSKSKVIQNMKPLIKKSVDCVYYEMYLTYLFSGSLFICKWMKPM